MKIALLAATALSLLVSAQAMAADAVAYQESAPAAYDWTGFYVGASGGYVSTAFRGAGATETFGGGVLGAHAGYNWQYGPWVFGAEVDAAHTWNSRTAGGASVGTSWQSSLRARLGYAFDRTLVYATGGAAFSNLYMKPFAGPISFNEGLKGWTVGGGVEHAFTDNWIARVEYRYSDFGKAILAGNSPANEHTIRVGISYKF